MYDIPSDSDVKKVVITKECVLNGEKPLTETAKTSVKEKFKAKTSAGPKNVGWMYDRLLLQPAFFVLAVSLLFTAKTKLPP